MTRYSFILIPPLTSFSSEDELRRTFDFLRECGYQGVELNLTDPLGVKPDALLRMVDECGLVVPSFLTGEAYRDGLCLSSPDAEVRRRTVERLIEYLDLADRFGAILVVGLLQGLRSDEPDSDIANERIRDGLRRVADAAERKSVEIVVEPVNHLQVGFNNSLVEVRALIARIGSSAIRPMVDTVHMNIEERSLTQPILDCGASLRHVHLCESNGGLFGTGNIDFAAVLRTLQGIDYDRFASVKVYRQSDIELAAESSMRFLNEISDRIASA